MNKRIKKGSAVLTAWTLIAVMGISPTGAGTEKPKEWAEESETKEAEPNEELPEDESEYAEEEMPDHFDGEGTQEAPYLLRNANDLKLLAYQVAN